MKKAFFIMLFAASTSFAMAQTAVTLNSENMPLKSGMVDMNAASTQNFTNPVNGASQTWDYGTITNLGPVFTEFLPSDNNSFSNTTLVVKDFPEVLVSGKFIFFDQYYDKNQNGLYVAGISTQAQAYGIGEMSGNENDTFYVEDFTDVYAEPQILLAFPATAGSHWSSHSIRRMNYKITLTNFFMNKAPGHRISHFIATDTVAGWGKMRVPAASGAGKYYNVLMVKQKVMRIDSMYLNNSPAPDVFLAPFGLKQSDTTYAYQTYFYRPNDAYPLMVIDYDAADYNTPTKIIYNADSTISTGILNIAKNNIGYKIFPNPVKGSHLQLAINKYGNSEWDIKIVNMLGQQIASEKIKGTGNLQQTIQLPENEPNGIYMVYITDENADLIATEKIILAR